MKKTRKLMMIMLTLLIVAMIPGTAFAKKAKKAGKSYVPTAGTEYKWDEETNTWEPSGESFKAVFDKQGRVRSLSVAWADDAGRFTDYLVYTYAWKGDNIKKESLKYTSSDDGKSSESYSIKTTYKVKKKRPVKEKYVCYYYDKDGQIASSSTIQTTYRWDKDNKNGSRVTKSRSQNRDDTVPSLSRSTDVYTLKNGRLSTSWMDNYSYKYYKNGNLKSVSRTGEDGRTKDVTKYNNAGYRVKHSRTVTDDDGAVTKNVTTYKWTISGGKPKSVEWFTRDQSGTVTDRYRYEYTKTRKVKQTRNCDVFGFEVWLGLWGEL